MADVSPLPERWSCDPHPPEAADRIAEELGLAPTTAAILARRGHLTPAAARRFLAAEDRHDPLALGDTPAACDLILGHVERGSRIVVHGDYDVDGVCSTAVAVRALRRLGADPAWHLPSRFDGGYGLLPATVERLASGGCGLLVTVDCGITAAAEVEQALALGVDVVVTDHHRPPERLPDCPLVHPALGGYPFPDLCAAGVAHKLAEALYLRAGMDPRLAEEDLDLVGLATVADVVPLRGENRRLVREGVRAMGRTVKPGLRALMKIAALEPGAVDTQAVGFGLGPRLNAAGRLGSADAALELLLTEDANRATEVADELDLLNHERRDTETRMLFAAEAARGEAPDDAPAYVLAGEGWHAGVIGIVASRMVERHHRPCVLVALGDEGGRGSGRSIAAYDLHAGLSACAGHLGRFGGHAMAAGFDIEPGEVDAFRTSLMAHAAGVLSPEDLMPVEHVDAVVPGGALGLELAEELERLGPFGQGNPVPTLLLPAARVSGATSMGDDRQHCRFTVSSGGSRAAAVGFRTTAAALAAAGSGALDVAVRLERREWRGVVEPRLVLRAVCPPRPGRCRVLEPAGGLLAAVERELIADPRSFGRGAVPHEDAEPDERAVPHGGAVPHEGALPHEGTVTEEVAGAAAGRRGLRDRRGQGFAGVVGELLAAGAQPLLVCAETSRRLEGLESLVAGLADGACGAHAPPRRAELEITSWDSFAADPRLAASFDHLVAVDPPPAPAGERLLLTAAAADGPGLAHLAWGPAEVAFALAVAEAELDLRSPLTGVYRDLRDAPDATGEALECVLRGTGRHPRSAALCARLVRVLVDLGLVRWEREAGGEARCVVLEGVRTTLESSHAHRAYLMRLAAVRRHLGWPAEVARRASHAAA